MKYMEKVERKSINDKLYKYCYISDKDKAIEITEWVNGEGWDICIGDERIFSLSYGELDAINFLTNALKYYD